MTKTQLKKAWIKLDKEVQDRTVYLSLMCTPYDMDDAYQILLKKEAAMLKEMGEKGVSRV